MAWYDAVYDRLQARWSDVGQWTSLPRPGATQRAIEEAEQLLGVTFPPSFREFLRRYSGAKWCNNEFACIEADALSGKRLPPDVVKLTETDRSRGLCGVRHVVVYFADYETAYLDTSAVDSRGESPVVLRGAGERQFERVAQDFATWLERKMDESGE